MSAPKKSTPTRPLRTGKPSKVRQPNRKSPTAAQLPDLEPILFACLDAHSLVRCASKTLHESDSDEDEQVAVFALRQGVAALETAIDRLRDAEMEVSRFRKKGRRCAVMLLRIISSAAFVFGTLFLFWPLPLTVRIALAGIYFLIGTVAVVGELVLLRLDDTGGRLL